MVMHDFRRYVVSLTDKLIIANIAGQVNTVKTILHGLWPSLRQHSTQRRFFVMGETVNTTSTTTKKRVYTPEQRQRNAAYVKAYRARNPDRVKQWRRNYIMAAAARLQAEAGGGAEHGGD